MADVKRYVEIVFAAKDESAPAIDSLNTGLNSVALNIHNVVSPMQDAVVGILKFDAALLGAAAAVVTFAIKAAGDFDTSFQEISTLFDAGEGDTRHFRDAVLDAAGQSSGSFDSFTGAIYDAVSAGVDFKDSIDFVNAAEKLAIGGRAELRSTTELLVSTLNAYGVSTDHAGEFSDILFQTVKIGITTIPQLTSAIGRVAPTAAAAGVSFADLNAGVAILTKNGIDTNEAVTGLKAALSNIIKPTDEAQKAAAALGIKFDVASLSSKGLGGFMADLDKKTGGNITTMGKLFGSTEALNAVMVLTQGGAGGLKDAIGLMGKSAGSAQAAYDKMAQTLPIQTNIMMNALRAAFTSIGAPMLAPFIGLEHGATLVFQAIKRAADNEAFKPLQDLIVDVFGNIEDFLTTLAAHLPEALAHVDFTSLTAAIRALGAALGSTFDNIDISTPEGLAKAFQLVVNAVTGLVNMTTGMVEFFSKLGQAAINLGPRIVQFAEDHGRLVGQIIAVGATINLLLPTLLRLGGGISAAAGAISDPAGLATSFAKLVTGSAPLIATLGVAGVAGATLYYADQALNGGRATNALTSAFSSALDTASDYWLGTNNLADAAKKAATEFDNVTSASTSTAEAYRGASDRTSSLLEVQKFLYPLLFQGAEVWHDNEVAVTGWSVAAGPLAEILKNTKTEVEQYAEALGLSNNNMVLAEQGFTKIAGVITNVTPLYGKMHAQATPALEDVTKETDKAKESAQKFELEWAKLASSEREVIFKCSADIAVAQIEAQAAQVVAAFESIGVTVQSTGELMAALADSFINARTESDQSQILAILKEEQKNRAEALRLQKELSEAQIKVLQAQARRLESGDAFITIAADGLEPELEAFMFKILAKIHTKASADAQQFLLGL